jgi:hypothetical protein
MAASGGNVTLPRKINGPKDVARFFNHITEVESINFHPDERFHTYGRDVRGVWKPAYTTRQADARDELMNAAWAVCAEYGLDIYCMAMWSMYRATGAGAPDDCLEEKKYFVKEVPGPLDWKPEA